MWLISPPNGHSHQDPGRAHRLAGMYNVAHGWLLLQVTSGTKLGPYEIQSPHGAGGMGEVYRARDTRLDRTVAIKILPIHLSSNPDLRARFEQEVRAISAMQHPNICVLDYIGSRTASIS
jgi:serine/threonine protein kinase